MSDAVVLSLIAEAAKATGISSKALRQASGLKPRGLKRIISKLKADGLIVTVVAAKLSRYTTPDGHARAESEVLRLMAEAKAAAQAVAVEKRAATLAKKAEAARVRRAMILDAFDRDPVQRRVSSWRRETISAPVSVWEWRP